MPDERVLRAVVLDDGEMNNLLTVTALRPIAGCVMTRVTLPSGSIRYTASCGCSMIERSGA